MHTRSFELYVKCIRRDDRQGAAELMLSFANNRAHRCPGRTSPRSAPCSFRARVPLPRRAWNTPARRQRDLLGNARSARTGWCTPEHRRTRRSQSDHRGMVCGVFKSEAVAYHQRVIERMKGGGCEAVVLGCTEIPLIMNDSNSPLPTPGSTRLLGQAALRRAVLDEAAPALTVEADKCQRCGVRWSAGKAQRGAGGSLSPILGCVNGSSFARRLHSSPSIRWRLLLQN